MGYKLGGDKCPLEATACDKSKSRADNRKGLQAYLAAAEICPKWCKPGSKKTDKYGFGAASLCITGGDISQLSQQIKDMPKYKCMGTNCKIPAGPDADVCRMVENFMEGWKAAGGEEELIEADPDTIKHAEDEKNAKAADATAAGKIEAKWTKKEAKYTKKAAALKAKDEKLKDDAEKANAEAAKKEASDAADAEAKVIAANKATADAEKSNAEMQKKYDAEEKKLDESGKKADSATKARLKKFKDEIASNDKKIADGKKAAEQAADDQKKAAADNKAALHKAAKEYSAKTAELKKKYDAEEKSLGDEKKKFEDKFAKEDAKNKSDAAAEALKIAKEKTMNKIKAAAEMAKINKDAAAVSAAHAKEEEAYHKVEAEKAKALAETREGKKKATEKKAAEDEATYQAKKKVADKMQADADAADKKEKDYAAKMKKDQADEDKAEDAEDHTDMEMKGCKSDGTECELDSADGSTMTCHAVKNPPAGVKADPKATFYMAKDLVSCTKDKKDAAVDKGYAGSDWTGLTDAPTPAPVKPDAKCLKLRKAFYGGYGKDHPTASSIACSKKLTPVEQKSALEAYFDMGAACPETCDKGSDVHTKEVNGDDTVNKICVTSDDIDGMKAQITDMPVYKAMGTNKKIPAGPKADVCRMAKSMEAGWAAGKALK
jgi:hypothetical protein